MLGAILVTVGICLVAAVGPLLLATGRPQRDASLVHEIDARLPQTQCEQCGYPGCRPYAEAIAHGEAEINRCPPGGDVTIRRLAHLLGRPVLPLDRTRGETKPRAVAWIDEELCIGCKLCIKACPVDAIVGAAKLMHTVIEDECTGCELCVDPCPVDCIAMRAPRGDHAEWPWRQPKLVRTRPRV